MNTHMINELKESNLIINKIINMKEDIFININKNINDNNIIFTWMWSSYFIWEIGNYFFKNLGWNKKTYSYSADEIENNLPYVDENYYVITCSQSGNTKEVSDILIKLKEKNISNFCLVNNLNGEHIKLSDNNFFLNIWLEKAPVSTKYVIYTILFLYKLSLFYWVINNNLSLNKNKKYLNDIKLLEIMSENVFEKYNDILKELTKKYNLGDHFIIIWNWLNNILAKEISLKIRETTWINSNYENIGQLNHWWINSINEKSICILLEDNVEIDNKIIKRWWKIITIWDKNKCDINFERINKYIDSIQKLILLQYFVHKLASTLNINTDKKMW